jgi:uncharacterized protein (DUF302 family)/uncharacterized membrane protein YidH (DUF202 family)
MLARRRCSEGITRGRCRYDKMETPKQVRNGAALNDYLAAERTFLAWVRTGLALMGFGFVVARFGLFLGQLQLVQRAAAPPSTGLSLWFGTALIAAGVVMQLTSAWQHIRSVRDLDRGETQCSRSLIQAIAPAVFLALVGIAMAIYLLSVRGSSVLYSQNSEERLMPTVAEKGIIDKLSHHSVEETVGRLTTILQTKGVNLFALVDHSGEAEKVGMRMRPTKLLIFGSPKAGTPLMQASPSIAIDLPLKILVWEDGEGKVWISYNSPAYLKERHGLPQELLANIAVVETLAMKAGE